MSTQSSGVCDICGTGISSPSGYLLVTREVVGRPEYWQHYYRQHEGEFALLGVRSYEAFKGHPTLRAMSAKMLAGQSTPWMVCEGCIGLFDVDRRATRRYAEQWWQSGGTFAPPGVGPAPLSAVNMDEAPVAAPRGPAKRETGEARPAVLRAPARREGIIDRLMRPWRVKRVWDQSGHEKDNQAALALLTELLDLLDERSTKPDIGRVHIVRGNHYFWDNQLENALADYTEGAAFYLERGDLSGVLECERCMSLLHRSRIEEAARGSEKAERLSAIHWATPTTALGHDPSQLGFEKLLSFLGDPDPDVRAYAALHLYHVPYGLQPDYKRWLIAHYRKQLGRDADLAARVGRHVGWLLYMGPTDVYPADLVQFKLGADVRTSFVNCTCAHCGYLNRGIPVPPAGAVVPYFSRAECQGRFGVPALCVRCNREFAVTWDVDPRR